MNWINPALSPFLLPGFLLTLAHVFEGHQQSFGFRLMPFFPQYPIHGPMKTIGQQDQYL